MRFYFKYLTLFFFIFSASATLQGLEITPLRPQAKIGFSEIEFFDDFHKIQRSLLVWYPIDADAEVHLSPNPWDLFDIGIDAPIAYTEKKPPIVVISHGWNGNPHELSWLIRELVHAGFFVVAIQHRDFINGKAHINHWMRAQDISLALDHFLSSPLGALADSNKIGIVGFSLGGTTALWLAGGRTTILDSVMPSPEYADPDNFSDINQLLPDLNKEAMSKDWKDSRVKAAFIMAPAWSWIFDKKSLEKVAIPIYMIAGANDEVIKTSFNARLFAKYIPGSVYEEIPGKAGHFIFLTTLNTEKRAVVDPCGKLDFLLDDDESVDRHSIQNKVSIEAIRFFQEMLEHKQTEHSFE